MDKRKDYFWLGIALLAQVLITQVVPISSIIDLSAVPVGIRMLLSDVLYVLPTFIYVVVRSTKRKTAPKLIRFNKLKFSNFLLCILVYLCLMPALTFINLLSQLYSQNYIVGAIAEISSDSSLLVSLLVVAILPGLFEEFTYRGAIYGTLRQHSPLFGMIAASVFFGLAHENLNQCTYAIAAGFVFCVLVEATDSLFASVTVHVLINFFATLITYGIPKLFGYLSDVYMQAKQAGDTATMQLIGATFEESGLDPENLQLDTIMQSATEAVSKQEILSMALSYLIPAVIGTFLAVLLIRFIAKRCGRLEHLKTVFGRKSDTVNTVGAVSEVHVRIEAPAEEAAATEQEAAEPAQSAEEAEQDTASGAAQNEAPGTIEALSEEEASPYTWALISAAVVMFVVMILYELIQRGIIA